MTYYSFDLSYYPNKDTTDTDIGKITNKYPSCEWYASDMGPFGKNSSAPLQRNNGFNIKDYNEFKNLINEVNKTPGIFFDFVTKYINKNDDDPIDIYCSPGRYQEIMKKYREEYDNTIKNLEGTDLEIYNLIMSKK